MRDPWWRVGGEGVVAGTNGENDESSKAPVLPASVRLAFPAQHGHSDRVPAVHIMSSGAGCEPGTRFACWFGVEVRGHGCWDQPEAAELGLF